MKITAVRASWLRAVIPPERQHVSDFGRMETFDCTLVAVTTEDGLTGYGEAKAAVGSAGVNGAVVASVEQELRPLLLGEDSREIARLWERMYNGSRDHFALSRGRGFPILGRRGVTISAISGVDMALWDLLGATLRDHDPEAIPVPVMAPFATDAKATVVLGTPTYGFSPLRLEPDERYLERYHGVDERIGLDALRFGLPVLYDVVRRFCG